MPFKKERPDQISERVRDTPLYLYSDQVTICAAHLRDMNLQPFTYADQAKGLGTIQCPFCNGGRLFGQYKNCRYREQMYAALDTLIDELQAEDDATTLHTT